MENEEKKAKTVSLFCANEQAETEHGIDIDAMGEVILTCECGRFVKLPKGTTAKELHTFVESHKESNTGQVSQESVEAAKEALLADL